jgi:hypothetical protein
MRLAGFINLKQNWEIDNKKMKDLNTEKQMDKKTLVDILTESWTDSFFEHWCIKAYNLQFILFSFTKMWDIIDLKTDRRIDRKKDRQTDRQKHSNRQTETDLKTDRMIDMSIESKEK